MTTDYDEIAEQYKRSKLQPWRTWIESYSLLDLWGDVTGRKSVDLACGEGYYTRLLKSRGATPVTGVDLSAGMIELARRQEDARPLGIEYRTGDARQLALPAEYDLATAAYLLNYARDLAELTAMCRGAAGCLRPGGRFVTVNSSPLLDFTTAPSYLKYGFETRQDGAPREGAAVTWTFHLEEGQFSIENYALSAGLHEEAVYAAGFREVRWIAPALSPHVPAALGADLWELFLRQPPIVLIECVK